MIVIYIIIIGVSIAIIYDAVLTIKSIIFWRTWKKQSFEFENGRYNKDTFKVTNGKIEFK